MNLELLEKTAASCKNCSLHKGRINPVFSKGNSDATIMICGMVPADEENKSGLPFVGKAGQLLDKIMKEAGLTLNDVYITNLVKCYLAAGLNLQQEWINSCLPYLIVQIDLIKPKVVLTLGKDASITLLSMNSTVSLGSIRKKIYNYGHNINIVPTYHPSYLLRAGGESHKNYKDVIDDFLTAISIS